MSDDSGTAAGRRRLAYLAVGLVLGAAVSWWATSRLVTSSSQSRQTAAPRRTITTVAVTHQPLQSVLNVAGTVAASQSFDVDVSPVSVPGAVDIVSSPPPVVGAQLAAGDVALVVAGRPVFVLPGPLPMYRTLGAGDRGPDVRQLQVDLAGLGLDAGPANGVFDSATQAAVRRLYTRAFFAPALSTAATDGTGPATPSTATAGAATPSTTAAPAPTVELPQAELVFVPTLPAQVAQVRAQLGQPPPSPALRLSAGSLVVTAPLTSAQAALVAVGQPAAVTLAAGTGAPAAGHVVAVTGPEAGGDGASSTTTTVGALDASTTTQGGANAAADPGLSSPRVQIELSAPIDATQLGHDARVQIVVARTSGPVLAVPVGALTDRADGTSMVIVVHGTRQTPVTVVTGQVIGGMVEIRSSRPTLRAGDPVAVSGA